MDNLPPSPSNIPPQPTQQVPKETIVPKTSQQAVGVSGDQSSINLASLFIRLGLIFVFGWAAVVMSLNPTSYIHYMPIWVETLLPRTTALHVFSVYEIILCLWLLTGKKMMYAGILSAITIATLTGVNYTEFGVLFRNVSIFFSSVALALLSRK